MSTSIQVYLCNAVGHEWAMIPEPASPFVVDAKTTVAQLKDIIRASEKRQFKVLDLHTVSGTYKFSKAPVPDHLLLTEAGAEDCGFGGKFPPGQYGFYVYFEK